MTNKINVQIELSQLNSAGADNQQWRAVMDHYAPSSAPRDTFSQTGFLAAKIFVDAVSKLPADKINRATVTNALRAVHNFKTDLLCRPWYFGNANEHNANNVGLIVRLTGTGATGFTDVKGCTSVEDPDLAPIRAAEAQ
jgi:branched-chain amino acid transport system substrate-binding protein